MVSILTEWEIHRLDPLELTALSIENHVSPECKVSAQFKPSYTDFLWRVVAGYMGSFTKQEYLKTATFILQITFEGGGSPFLDLGPSKVFYAMLKGIF